MAAKRLDLFDGEGDVAKCVTRIQLHGLVKWYTGDKSSYYLAEKLQSPAFGVFLRLSADDRKDFDKVKDELYKEFKSVQKDREEAIRELSRRKRLLGESIRTFSYNLMELVKFVYPTIGVAPN